MRRHRKRRHRVAVSAGVERAAFEMIEQPRATSGATSVKVTDTRERDRMRASKVTSAKRSR
jgi:hypothetical protein